MREEQTLQAPPQPITDRQSASDELFALAMDTLRLAQDCDSLGEKNRLIRAAVAWLNAAKAGGEFQDVAGQGWQPLGRAVQRVVARVNPHD